jgi:hypothetical protein
LNENEEKDLDRFPDCIEKPTMRVDLLLILCLEDENDLDRKKIVWVIGLGKNELWCGVDGKLSCVLEEKNKVSISFSVSLE